MRAVVLVVMLSSALLAEQAVLDEVEVAVDIELLKDVSYNQLRSADLSDALFRDSESVSMVRRSAVANDIIIRGQKKDDITVTIDGAKVHGACVNRMDPPVSHVLSNNIDYIELQEGPFDVEEFGSLSASVKIHTKKPSKDLTGALSLTAGSFGYYKGALELSGGAGIIRALLSTSYESSEQYRDGNSDTLAEQLESSTPSFAYIDSDRDAYEKDTVMLKLYADISDKQLLKFGYTRNRSSNILYPSSKMDALYDDSDIYTLSYTINDLSSFSKLLDLSMYHSTVDHPMSTKYRKISLTKGYEMTHALSTAATGVKLKNSFKLDLHSIDIGIDYSLRNWDGAYFKDKVRVGIKSLDSVDTTNRALFIKDRVRIDRATFELGLRADNTDIESQNSNDDSREFSSIGGFLLAKLHVSDLDYFIAVGRSSRVPDAKELYFRGMMGNSVGTSDLKQTTNSEIDIGVDTKVGKVKLFYSYLNNYILYNDSNRKTMMGKELSYRAYENVDAAIYGFEISSSYYLSEALFVDVGLAYQIGERIDSSAADKDLPNIQPLKLNALIEYEIDESWILSSNIIASDEWSRYDADNGEQRLDGYVVVDLKTTKKIAKQIELTVGVDNLFDETYAVSNTYKDLTLLSGSDGSVMLLNEPGRYMYVKVGVVF